MRVKRTMVAILAMAAVVALGTTAQAAVLTFTLNEVGNSVVGTVSGSVNTDALGPVSVSTNYGNVCPTLGIVLIGPENMGVKFIGLEGDASNFGWGGWTGADTGVGNSAGLALFGQKAVYVPRFYVSGSELSGSSTWDNRRLEPMGITPGTYTWTYNGGADSVVLQVGSVPEPATMGLLVLGGIATLIRRACTHRQRDHHRSAGRNPCQQFLHGDERRVLFRKGLH